MVTSAHRLLHALAAALVAVLALSACAAQVSLAEAETKAGIPAAAVVQVSDDLAIAAGKTSYRSIVTEFNRRNGSWTYQQLSSGPLWPHSEVTVNLTQWTDASGRQVTVVFGTAPQTATHVDLAGVTAKGGQVVGGSWALAVEGSRLTTDAIHWRILDSGGTVLREGTGIKPPA